MWSIEQPIRFGISSKLKAARALNPELRPSLLAGANAAIE
jgi:hypothetical protein